jgi:hypothetical protein
MRMLGSAWTWTAVAIAVAAVAAVIVVVANRWTSVGATQISAAGWLAMAFGILVTLALGIGLMALVFLSSRGGYDEMDRRDR